MRRLSILLCVTVLIFGVLGTAYCDLNDGLVAYYPFNDNSNDKSGNGFGARNHNRRTYFRYLLMLKA